MRPINLIVMGTLLVSILLLSGCIDDALYDYGHYDRTVERYYDTEEEKLAIHHAENSVNYSRYTNLSRWENEWANYIDNDVFEHFNESFTEDREAEREADIYFEYFAYSRFYPELNFKMRNNGYSLELKLNNEMFMEGIDYLVYFEFEISEMVIVHLENESWVFDKERWDDNYWEDDFNIELFLNFTNVFAVVLDLTYDDIWGSLAATYVHTTQFLILDENYDPLVIGVVPSPWMVS